MDLKFLKNPIILGIFAAVIAYLYLYWQEDRKQKENAKYVKQPINILIPGVIGILVWFLSSYYFDSFGSSNNSIDSKNIEQNLKQSINSPEKPNLVAQQSYKLTKSDDSLCSKSYHLVGKNKVRLPPTDVFIDVAKF
ncbi:Hypothetical protein KVN_LOCUS370 [uncultured virus]|nr:Hypothetical protein KVN_LOCUS370 [uncultured virus]